MKLTIEYFAILKEQRGCSSESMETPANYNPAELYEALKARHGFSLDRSALKVAVNEDFADWDQPLEDGDTVVFIPPSCRRLARAKMELNRFLISELAIEPQNLRAAMQDEVAGAYVAFEGWVRNHNDGKSVNALEYSAYKVLAEKEGNRIIEEALERFDVSGAAAIHRVGPLDLGDIAVWVGVSSPHRGPAFDSCRYIIDQIKDRVPIWKQESYESGPDEWVNCARKLPE